MVCDVGTPAPTGGAALRCPLSSPPSSFARASGPGLRRGGRPQLADHLLLILSDIEMGPGGPVDDFPHSGVLADLLLSYNEGDYGDVAIDLVFNGDTFDLLKTPYEGSFPRHITGAVALGKMVPIMAAHPRFFDAIQRFLDHDRADRRVHFIAGNHDAELAFVELQTLVRQRCGGDEL